MSRFQPITVLVGPTHPHTGGIAQHTTRLALELEKRGEKVVIESWKHQYPRFFYPVSTRVPDSEPEIGVAPRVVEKLSWFSPLSWWLSGRRSMNAATIAVSVPTPLHAIVYTVLFKAAGSRPKRVGIIHNVLPHERLLGSKWLMRVLLQQLDLAVVHNADAAREIRQISQGRTPCVSRSLPSPWATPPQINESNIPSGTALRLLFFGTVRPYKGLDTLLRALAQVPNCELLVAGEFWEKQEIYDELIARLGISERVTLQTGYVQAKEIPQIFSKADVLVLPYKSATGSIVRELGFDFGLPVVASDVGSLGEGIISGQNGEVVPAGDSSALAQVLKGLARPGHLEKLKAGARNLQVDRTKLWSEYADAICT
jgi:D-inositol-3-phosphate glycosyltransferase